MKQLRRRFAMKHSASASYDGRNGKCETARSPHLSPQTPFHSVSSVSLRTCPRIPAKRVAKFPTVSRISFSSEARNQNATTIRLRALRRYGVTRKVWKKMIRLRPAGYAVTRGSGEKKTTFPQKVFSSPRKRIFQLKKGRIASARPLRIICMEMAAMTSPVRRTTGPSRWSLPRPVLILRE